MPVSDFGASDFATGGYYVRCMNEYRIAVSAVRRPLCTYVGDGKARCRDGLLAK